MRHEKRRFVPAAIVWCVVIQVATWATVVRADKEDLQGEPTPRFVCGDFLANGRDANVKAFEKGARVHHTNAKVQAFEDRTRDDLELGALTGPMTERLLTSFGKLQLTWLLSNPSLDPAEIRERQAAVAELRANPELRESIRTLLDKIRVYEQRDSWWDRFWVKLAARVNLPLELKKRSIVSYFTSYNVKPHWLADSMKTLGTFVWPLLGGMNIVNAVRTGNFAVGAVGSFGLPMFLNYGTQRSSREALGQFKGLVKNATALEAALSDAKSLHLRELADIFSAVDDKQHPLGFSRTARTIRGVWTNPFLTRLVDATFVSNIPLLRGYFKVRSQLDRLIPFATAMGELDMLLSFADQLDQDSRYCMPTILGDDAPVTVKIQKGLHPVLAIKKEEVVPNSVHLEQGNPEATQLLFLTGLNARGKSTYVRTIALSILLAQIGAPVPAESMTLTPVRLQTTMRRSDSIEAAESLFRSEAKRIAGLLKEMKEHPRTINFLDEVFSGTSAQEKMAAERALLQYLSDHGFLAVVASHERHLTALEGVVPGFRNFHVSDSDERRFQLEPGASRRRNAFAVLREEGVPEELLRIAYAVYEGPAELDGLEGPQP